MGSMQHKSLGQQIKDHERTQDWIKSGIAPKVNYGAHAKQGPGNAAPQRKEKSSGGSWIIPGAVIFFILYLISQSGG